MPHRIAPETLGRAAALCWLAVAVLLLRMATNGSFIALALQDDSTGGAIVAFTCASTAVVAVLLAASLVRWSHSRPLVISAGAGLLMTPLALPLLSVNHYSAVALPPLGLLAAILSLRAARDLQRSGAEGGGGVPGR